MHCDLLTYLGEFCLGVNGACVCVCVCVCNVYVCECGFRGTAGEISLWFELEQLCFRWEMPMERPAVLKGACFCNSGKIPGFSSQDRMESCVEAAR